jgi:type VI secretion system protein ImpE
MPTPSPTLQTQSFTAWLQHQSLDQAIAQVEASVRNAPSDAVPRWALFELLCITEQWARAIKQLQVCARLSPELEPTAQLMRGLIKAHHQREQVFQGQQAPVPVVDVPPWMQHLMDALALHAPHQKSQADEARQQGLALAPSIAGSIQLRTPAAHNESQSYAFIADSDTRLGPVCEVIMAGSYRWLAFADIAGLTPSQPKSLLDYVFLPAQLKLKHSPVDLNIYLPVRYPTGADVAQADAAPTAALRQALQLAQHTVWREAAPASIYAQGQKTLMTQLGDVALFDIAYFGSAT